MNNLTLATQTRLMLQAFGLGFIIGIIYDLFRIIRLSISRGKTAVFIQDIIFFILFSGITFSFCLSLNNGKVRFFIVFAEIIGFLIYYISFGTFVIKFSDRIIGVVKKIFLFIAKMIAAPLNYLFGIIRKITKKFATLSRKSSKKVNKKFKNLLQLNRALLYNTLGRKSAKQRKQRGEHLD